MNTCIIMYAYKNYKYLYSRALYKYYYHGGGCVQGCK